MSRYQEVSEQVFEILQGFSPVIEPLSIDEAFIDLTGAEHLFGSAEAAAKKIKQRVRHEVGLTTSVGVAPNKFLAKLASDLQKPDGLTVIGPDDVDRVLPPLPITRIWGVGKVSAGRFERMGVRTIGDLRRRGFEWLAQCGGNDAQRLWDLAHGIDSRIVISDHEAKSIGHETTFEQDLMEADAVRDVLLSLTEQVAVRLRRHGARAKGVALKIRFGDFEKVTRSATLPEATDVTQALWQAIPAHAPNALVDCYLRNCAPPGSSTDA
jgi:DNA polymerase-4